MSGEPGDQVHSGATPRGGAELFAAALCSALSRTAIAHGAGRQVLRGQHDARSMSEFMGQL